MQPQLVFGLGLLFAALTAQAIEPFASTYHAIPAPPTLVRDATLLIGDGTRIEGGDLLLARSSK
jgi:hypothetical protein